MANIRFTLIVFMIVLCMEACSPSDAREENERLRDTLLDVMERAKKDNTLLEIDLQKISKKTIDKICIQTSYMPKDWFEKMSGRSAHGFVEVDDSANILWFFFKNGSSSFVKVYRWKIMDKKPDSVNCSSISPVLSFDRSMGSVEYFVNP